MANWYNGIEPKVRKVVRLLRDNGWNTTCSCGHGMWIEFDFSTAHDLELLRLLLLDHGWGTFHIQADIFCTDSWPTRRARVCLGRLDLPVQGGTVLIQELAVKVKQLKEEIFHLGQRHGRGKP